MDEGPNFVPGKIYVSPIPPTITNGQLKDHFANYGVITDSVIKNDDVTGQRYGYGFVNFADPSAVDKAIGENDHLINGHLVRVAKSKLKVRCIDQEHFKTTRLHVYLIPQHVSLDALARFFGEYGKVITCSIERDKHYASIYFQSDKTVDDILAANGNWINFRGGFRLEISKHITQRHLNNANSSGEGGDFGAHHPHQRAVYNPARYGSAAHGGCYGGQNVVGQASVFTEGASSRGGPSIASQDDNRDSMFSYAMVTKKGLNRHR